MRKADILDPAQVFDLFFTSEVIDLLVRHTNAYAEVKDANSGDKAWELPGRIWKEVSAIELKQWIGMLIYMGVFSGCGIRDYWRKSTLWPVHPLCDYMSLTRFQQILHYFHISDPSVMHEDDENDGWTYKVDPLLEAVHQASSKYYTPQTNVSIDEATIRFCGRSRDTFKMPNKPIAEGYKAFCLADHGYLFDFAWHLGHNLHLELKILIISAVLPPQF